MVSTFGSGMSTTLRCANVINEKIVGELQLDDSNVSWRQLNSEKKTATVSLVLPIDQVTRQFSANSRDKGSFWKLEVSGENYVFQFKGDHSEKERNCFQKRTQELMDKRDQFRRKKELQSRKRKLEQLTPEQVRIHSALYAGSTNVRKIHEELIKNDILNEAEFWECFKKEVASEKSNASHFRIGMNSTNLTDHQPTAELSDTKRYKLTPSVIQQIFVKYPGVCSEYKASVPTQMTENEFWTRYFRAQFYHKEKSTAPVNDAAILEKIEGDEERVYRENPSGGPADPSLDLRANEDDFQDSMADTTVESLHDVKRMIRLTNHHGKRVLSKSSSISPYSECARPDSFVIDLATEKEEQHLLFRHRRKTGLPTDSPKKNATECLIEDITISDLSSLPSSNFAPLDLQPKRPAYEEMGTMPRLGIPLKKVDVSRVTNTEPFVQSLDRWVASKSDAKPQVNFKSEAKAKEVCGDLTRIYKGNKQSGGVDLDPKIDISDECRRVNEILRHFWSCFPITPDSRDKARSLLGPLEDHKRKIEEQKKNSKYGTMWQATLDVIRKAFDAARANNIKK